MGQIGAFEIGLQFFGCLFDGFGVDVYENDLSQVHMGEYADIRLNAYPDKVLRGRIGNIGQIMDPNLRTAKVRLDVGEQITASFTIRVDRGDSIVGTGRATPSSSARYTSFAGTLTVTGGTGRYAHAHGSGKLYGALERKSDNLTVQTREGTLDY